MISCFRSTYFYIWKGFIAQSNLFLYIRIYDFYSFEIIPAAGYLVAGDWDSYQYLVESIRMFPSQVITNNLPTFLFTFF